MRVMQNGGHARTLCGWIVALVWLSGCEKGGGTAPPLSSGPAAPPDIAGIWLPDASRAEPWPVQLPLTASARGMLDRFNPSESDPTTFCMPLGTPRNMLQTEYPLEVVQTPKLMLLVVQPNLSNTEVRRIPLDGSAVPQSPDPSWFGTSQGRWEGSTLVIETTGLRADSLVSGNGLAHSEQLRVIERLSVTGDAGHGRTLVDEIELRDPKAYQEPLKTRRFFVWAPQAQPREGSCDALMWIDKLWRDRLKEHAEARRKMGRSR